MKKFLIKTAIFVIPVYIMMIWFGLSLKQERGTGDLVGIGGLSIGTLDELYRKDSLAINRVADYPIVPDSFRVVTFGDSFSQQGRGGYQNYLADAMDCDVLNITKRPAQPIELAVKMTNAGFFDTIPNAVVVIETVERALVERLAAADTTLNENVRFYTEPPQAPSRETMTTRFLTYVRLNLGFKNPVRNVKLKGDYFNGNRSNTLYFFKGDLYKTSPEAMKQAAEGMKRITDFFERKGITMIFFVAPDKYKVYRPFMVKERHKTTDLAPLYQMLEQYPNFVNPKKALTEAVANGVKDVYRPDDSHWSHIGARIAADELLKGIEKETERQSVNPPLQ